MSSRVFDAATTSSLSLCRTCRIATRQMRSFTSSSTKSNIDPENPRFIEVPQSVQETSRSKRPVKGTLPVPREIFPRRRPDKPSPQYLAAATPEPSSQKAASQATAPDAELNAWKSQMAATRRRNLREGLLELHQRKLRTDRKIAARSNYKQARRDELVHQAEREDQRLTNASIPQSLQPINTSSLPDPDREERLAESRALVEAKKAAKQGERQDALHTLYMNARNFITNEAQLVAEIEKVFPEGQNPEWSTSSAWGYNIWNLGTPPTVQAMVNAINRKDDRSALGGTKHWEVSQKRVKRLAEELTGGKL